MAPIGNIQQMLKVAGPEEFGPVLDSSAAAAVKDMERSGFVEKSGITGSSESFGSMVDRFVHEVDNKMNVAQVEQQKVLSGESQNLHQAMLAMQEANVSFGLMVEVRNKLVESYQELMRMQV